MLKRKIPIDVIINMSKRTKKAVNKKKKLSKELCKKNIKKGELYG